VPLVLRDAFRAELAEELQLAADTAGYAVALNAITPAHGEARVVESLLDLRCEALLLLSPELAVDELRALAERVPVVVLGRHLDAGPFDVVRVADDQGVELAVDHLVDLGHRRIVHVDGDGWSMAADRRTGFLTALARHGLPTRDAVVPGGYLEADGAAAARALLTLPEPPTAVVAANDRSAIGLLDVFLRAGVRVPQDISVVGYDDTELARLAHVDLTTVSQRAAEQAVRAVECAVSRLDGERTEPAEVVLPPRLVVRGTTGPPRSTEGKP
jgi:LacI family transcriptional regulator